MVALGATAAQSIIDPAFKVTTDRGVVLEPSAPNGPKLLATIHPSAVLRARWSEERAESLRLLTEDLATAKEAAEA